MKTKKKAIDVYHYDYLIHWLYLHGILIVMELSCLFACHVILLRLYCHGNIILILILFNNRNNSTDENADDISDDDG